MFNFVSSFDPASIELLKGGGLFALVVYLIYSDRNDRKNDREADVKRSEATTLMASALHRLVDYLNKKKDKEEL